jgi:WD40 repeat protein
VVNDTLFLWLRLAGQGDGSISLWKGRSPTVTRTVHTKAVNSLYTCTDVTAAFVSGGADGLVILWNSGLDPLKTFDLLTLASPPLEPEVRSVCALQGCLLIGTKSSEIIELNIVTGETDTHVKGHFKDELWGLSCHPLICHVATVGDEGTVRVWDAMARNIIHMRVSAGTGAFRGRDGADATPLVPAAAPQGQGPGPDVLAPGGAPGRGPLQRRPDGPHR